MSSEAHDSLIKEKPDGEMWLSKNDLRVAVLLSAIVGSWLVSYNEGKAILLGSFTESTYLRISLDYATPFVVSIVTSALHHKRKESST